MSPAVIREYIIREALLKKGLHSEIWGKGVCDIWEKWVVEE